MARKSKYTEAQIRSILDEVVSGRSVRDICRRHGFTEKTFYRWRARFGASSQAPEARAGADVAHVRSLEDENRRLRALVAELSLDNFSLRSAVRDRT